MQCETVVGGGGRGVQVEDGLGAGLQARRAGGARFECRVEVDVDYLRLLCGCIFRRVVCLSSVTATVPDVTIPDVTIPAVAIPAWGRGRGLLSGHSLGSTQRSDQAECLVDRILLGMRVALELARIACAEDPPIGARVIHILRGPGPGKRVCEDRWEERVERGGRDGEDTADAKGGRLGLALEGFSEGEEKVVGVDVVCVCAKRLVGQSVSVCYE